MKFQDINTFDDAISWLKERNFRQQSDEHLFKTDNIHYLRIREVEELDSKKARQIRNEYFGSELNVVYQLLCDASCELFIFQESHLDRKVTYDKNKSYAPDTEQILLDKINSIQFKERNFNGTMEDLFGSRLIDKFYGEYKGKRDELTEILGGNETHAQVILDRIIFIYFLQAKGVVPPDYLIRLYGNAINKGLNYYDDCLSLLFFKVFNTEMKLRDKSIEDRFSDIPYLNGGLFSHRSFETDAHIDNGYWHDAEGKDGFLDILEKYDWILIDEEKNESITPTVLGNIYEKSTHQKETGSFYTPETVTSYICENTVIPQLTEQINGEFGTDLEDAEEDLLDKPQLDAQEKKMVSYLYFEGLKKLTSCDPACGSGAFLYMLAKILFRLYGKCFNILSRERDFRDELQKATQGFSTIDYYLKREIITRNLFGVDIQEGCVEIAKLRLWLFMISEMDEDVEKIEPLPNIDYNLLVGNTLVGYTELPEIDKYVESKLKKQKSIDSFFGKEKSSGTGRKKISEMLNELQEMKEEYRTTRSSEKSREIREHVSENIVPLRRALNELYCREIGIETSEIVKAPKGMDAEEGGRYMLDALRDINDRSAITRFKITLQKPNDIDYDHIKSFDGMMGYRDRKTGTLSSVYPTQSFNWEAHNQRGRIARLIEGLIGDRWDKVKSIEITKEMGVEELEKLKPFHWALEFYGVFND